MAKSDGDYNEAQKPTAQILEIRFEEEPYFRIGRMSWGSESLAGLNVRPTLEQPEDYLLCRVTALATAIPATTVNNVSLKVADREFSSDPTYSSHVVGQQDRMLLKFKIDPLVPAGMHTVCLVLHTREGSQESQSLLLEFPDVTPKP
jgi:hypothetical protein